MVKKQNILVLGGAFIAFVTGSGFASGQEILQFFTAFGLFGSLGAGAVALITILWVTTTVTTDGRRLNPESTGSIYCFYCGNILGTLFEWVIPLLMFLFLTVMLSGAGATFHEYYGISEGVGRGIVAILTLGTVLLGLSRMVKIIGPIGIGIVLIAVVISLIHLFNNLEGLVGVDEVIKQIRIEPAFSKSWWVSGLLYGSFNVVTALPFLGGLGRQASSNREALWAGAFGSVSYIAAGILMNLALLSSISQVYNKQIPFLPVANSIFNTVGIVFSIMLLIGIYTTAAPMLWSICNLISGEEQRQNNGITALLLIILAYIGGCLPFGVLVGAIYPITGLVGFLLFICMFYSKYLKRQSS
ncbi:MAG: hypothetical protein PHR60_03645 [Eubacteriales bacterium]|nr:hypothetical protein [Eubacteriales bacterium]MDD4583265.1 hypothetical protein [Eubacteriales bacterium]